MNRDYYISRDHNESMMPIDNKIRYEPYPTPEQQRNLQLHPRNYTPSDRIPSTSYSTPQQDHMIESEMDRVRIPRLSSPIALGSRNEREVTDGNSSYYTYDNGRGRSGLEVPYQSPHSRINPESPNLAGAFQDRPKFEIPPSPHQIDSEFFPTLQVISWSPQTGEEGTTVTILLDPLVIHAAPSTATSSAIFGPGSPPLPELQSPRAPQKSNARMNQSLITRRFRIVFGSCVAPTKFSRIAPPSNLSRWSGEDTALVSLTAMVPARRDMGGLSDRAMVMVQILDESSMVLEDVLVGEWDAQTQSMNQLSAARPASHKRRGADISSEHGSPIRRNLSNYSQAPMSAPATIGGWISSPQLSQQTLSPLPGNSMNLSPAPVRHPSPTSPSMDTEGLPISGKHPIRHPPPGASTSQPELIRTSQIPTQPTGFGKAASFSNKAVLQLDGDLGQMAVGWTADEWSTRRRLVQFFRSQEGNVIHATFQPLPQKDFLPSSIVISCIYRDDKNECYVTSVDTIYLLEALVGVRFTVEEKNRIRRNLEGFKPTTVSKSKLESEPFFATIMGYVAPRPRTIEKDVKVFPWKILSSALKKIMAKYSATYSPSSGAVPPLPRELEDPNELQQQQAQDHQSLNSLAMEDTSSHHYPTETALLSSHHQPRPSFDFNSLLSGPSFSDTHYSGYSMDPQSHIAPGGAFLPTANHLFPSAEDYGVISSERHLPPPLNHVRSLSDGPREPIRRSLSGSSISYFQAGPGSGYSTITNPFSGDYGVGSGSNGGSWSGHSSISPTWGFGYDPLNGTRRTSDSWKLEYYGKTWGDPLSATGGLYQEI